MKNEIFGLSRTTVLVCVVITLALEIVAFFRTWELNLFAGLLTFALVVGVARIVKFIKGKIGGKKL